MNLVRTAMLLAFMTALFMFVGFLSGSHFVDALACVDRNHGRSPR